MPRLDTMKADLCDSFGNLCFFTKMQNHTHQAEYCNCLPKCNTIQISTNIESQTPIDTKYECEGIGSSYAAKKLRNVPFSKSVLYEMSKSIKEGKPFNAQNQTKKSIFDSFMKDIAIIEVQIGGQSYIKMRQTLRKTLGDKVGELGGTLGLFTGFSFMAIVELIYWILVTLLRIFKEAIPDPNRFRKY